MWRRLCKVTAIVVVIVEVYQSGQGRFSDCILVDGLWGKPLVKSDKWNKSTLNVMVILLSRWPCVCWLLCPSELTPPAISDDADCGRALVATCYHSSAFQPPTVTRLRSSTPRGKCWASLVGARAQTHKHSPFTRETGSLPLLFHVPLSFPAPPITVF